MILPSPQVSVKPGAKDAFACDPNLHLLYQGREWFSLRDEVHHGAREGFYRGAVACAFNEFPQCRDDLAPIIESASHPREAYQAHDLLTWAYMRRGEFRSALAHVEAMLAMRRNEARSRGTRALLSVLSQYPEQSIRQHHSSIVPCAMVEGNMFIPVAVNGISANFMIDSGATVSMITQSEAKRLGLTIQEVGADATKLYGATGAEISFQVVNAARLDAGQSQLANVSFLVLNDDQFQFPSGYAGALGLPVLIALQTLCWSADGTLRFGFPAQPRDLPHANICFDGPEIVTEAIFRKQKLLLVLDTGSGMTVFGPPFAKKFAKLIGRSSRKSSVLLSGVSGSAEVESVCLPRIALQVGGFQAVLGPAHVLLKSTTPSSARLVGRLGIDLLKQASRCTLDFHRMRLALE